MKEYEFEIVIGFSQTETANSEEEAMENVMESFLQDYSLPIDDSEITLISTKVCD